MTVLQETPTIDVDKLMAFVFKAVDEVGLALRRLVDQLERVQVGRARELGWSWADIARELSVSRQAAYKKHGRR